MNENQFTQDTLSERHTPFAGRQNILTRIRQYLTDPSDRHALLIIGRNRIGKSQILKQCIHVFDEDVIACYIPLANVVFSDEYAWVCYLVEQTNDTLTQNGFTIDRLPQLSEATPENYRTWFIDIYLAHVAKRIRSHRRLVWLMDDVEHLLQAIASNALPDDHLSYLYDGLQTQNQVGIVFTLNEDNEAQTVQLAPLVSTSLFQRLHPLSQDDTTDLIAQFGITTDTDTIAHIYSLTDGHPLILGYMGEALQPIRYHPVTITDVDRVTNDTYTASLNIYRHIWQTSLSQNERLILTAISGLLYDDPIADLTAERIRDWLLVTDYPLGMTAVYAGIRGLDYRDLIIGNVENIRIRGDLLQRWLIEYARMDDVIPQSNKTEPFNRYILLIIAIVILLVIIIIAFMQQPDATLPSSLQPTVTLGK